MFYFIFFSDVHFFLHFVLVSMVELVLCLIYLSILFGCNEKYMLYCAYSLYIYVYKIDWDNVNYFFCILLIGKEEFSKLYIDVSSLVYHLC